MGNEKSSSYCATNLFHNKGSGCPVESLLRLAIVRIFRESERKGVIRTDEIIIISETANVDSLKLEYTQSEMMKLCLT